MKNLFTTLCLFFIVCNCNAQDTLKLSELELLNNTSWKGKLTYKDYQSGKLTSIDATMQAEIDGEKIIYNVQYTYEPNKNNKSSIKIKKNGTYYGNEKIVSNTYKNGTRTFVTSYEGKDNGKKATMYITRQFNETSYKEIKEVLLKDSSKRFMRNTYEFTKIE
ncbi:hypothetical protein FBALC1_11537 [Flavobacteriales bacterium ALC-1]|nr:hypothetical protein FBALC1_11537 [Flavobacteriales bacterium ALC-1]